jgi:hypothetical protein
MFERSSVGCSVIGLGLGLGCLFILTPLGLCRVLRLEISIVGFSLGRHLVVSLVRLFLFHSFVLRVRLRLLTQRSSSWDERCCWSLRGRCYSKQKSITEEPNKILTKDAMI